MNSTTKPPFSDELAQRKGAHIELAQNARTSAAVVDSRFNYEPLFFKHPKRSDTWKHSFLGKELDYPLWVSSMTGGAEHAAGINENLAKLCGEFKLGMGLGSCRALLTDDSHLSEFKIRKHLGEQPLLANIGIAQVEQLVLNHKEELLHEVVKKVEADGLMIHINPLQEWFQPEGDRYSLSPFETLQRFLEVVRYPVMVKEVGQGLGPKSLKALLELPIAGIEFGAFGGTNFTLLESLRSVPDETRSSMVNVGHSAREMVDILNALPKRNKEFIISGGIKDMLDGYELKSRLQANSLIGMASGFLKYSLGNYEELKSYFLRGRETLLTSKGLLELRREN